MAILRDAAENKILDPLRTHNWTGSIEREFPDGVIIGAERGGHRHTVALIYSAATDNGVYKSLSAEVEHIFFNGAPYRVSDFTHGVDKPVSSADDFYTTLLAWNRTSAEGKFAAGGNSVQIDEPDVPEHRLLLSEDPIDAIWLRLRQLQSVTLARK